MNEGGSLSKEAGLVSDRGLNAIPRNNEAAAIIEPLTRTELIAALDGQIKDIEEESKRPGWSAWALLGGVASLLWMALSQFSSQTNFQAVGLVTLFGVLVVEMFSLAFLRRDELIHSKSKPLRFRSIRDDPNASQELMLFHLFRTAGLLALSLGIDKSLQVPSLSWYLGMQVFGITFILLFIWANRSGPNQSKLGDRINRATPIMNWLTIVWSAGICYILLGKLYLIRTTASVADFRLGVLLTGIMYGLQLIVSGDKERPLVNKLKTIRRDLAFGRITVLVARREIDNSVLGLDPSEVLTNAVEKLAAFLDNVKDLNESVILSSENANNILDELENNLTFQPENWTKTARQLGNALAATETHIKMSEKASNTSFSLTKAIMNSVKLCNEKKQPLSFDAISKWKAVINKEQTVLEQLSVAFKLHEEVKLRFSMLPKEYPFLEGVEALN